MKKSLFKVTLLLACTVSVMNAQPGPPEDFSFLFMTDIHLEYGKGAIDGFNQAIDTANRLGTDFVLTGGDLIADALAAKHSRADSLYALYVESVKAFEMPVYNTIGNHELYGLYEESGADTLDPDYYDGMYKRYLGKTYYSFDHKGWHFIVLNSIIDAGNSRYIGYIGDEQMEWLKNDLRNIDHETPVIVSTHIPFVTTYSQFRNGALAPNEEGLVITNSQEVFKVLQPYNLKLVLQGHLHIIEYINMQDKIRMLIGGAVSAHWWGGPNLGMEEGFMKIDIRDGEIFWNYIDYGWEAVK
ncbi:MAG: metallophosphoesterase [Bacteroidales bacterium]|jgi:3',5'-cyclic AMP phosphodiesterase CpdA